MAPAVTTVVVPASNSSIGQIRYFHRRILSFSRHSLARPSASRKEHSKPPTLDAAAQPSARPEIPLLPFPTNPTQPFVSEQLAPGPTGEAYSNSQSRGPNQPGDLAGNITAAVIVAVLVLGGLVGLVVGGEMLRRRVKRTKGVSRPKFGWCGRRKSRTTNNIPKSPIEHIHIKATTEGFPYDERTLTPLDCPLPVLRRDHRGRLSDVWPIRKLSLALGSHQTGAGAKPHIPRPQQASLVAGPQMTRSEFTPALLSVAPPRPFLARIPEEFEEDCQSQTGSEIAVTLGIALQRSLDSGSVLSAHPTARSRSLLSMHSEFFHGPESMDTTTRHISGERQVICKDDTIYEDTKSLGSSAPDMTSDGDSSRSSTTSLESLEDEFEGESLKEEMFELRRAQTRSMQMNKGVLLSLGIKAVDELSGDVVSPLYDGEGSSTFSRSASELDEGGHGESFSDVDLDDFPSPPSRLPMIPSFVSSF